MKRWKKWALGSFFAAYSTMSAVTEITGVDYCMAPFWTSGTPNLAKIPPPEKWHKLAGHHNEQAEGNAHFKMTPFAGPLYDILPDALLPYHIKTVISSRDKSAQSIVAYDGVIVKEKSGESTGLTLCSGVALARQFLPELVGETNTLEVVASPKDVNLLGVPATIRIDLGYGPKEKVGNTNRRLGMIADQFNERKFPYGFSGVPNSSTVAAAFIYGDEIFVNHEVPLRLPENVELISNLGNYLKKRFLSAVGLSDNTIYWTPGFVPDPEILAEVQPPLPPDRIIDPQIAAADTRRIPAPGG